MPLESPTFATYSFLPNVNTLTQVDPLNKINNYNPYLNLTSLRMVLTSLLAKSKASLKALKT
jgi:hypothetical protein